MLRWVRILHDKGWATPSWAPEWGGTGWDPVRQYIFKEELHMAPGARADLVQHEHDRPDADRLRQRRAEAPLPAAHRAHGGLVLPGLLGAGCRLGPGGAAHQRRPRRRPLRRQRPEALDLDRAPCRLVLPARAHRSGSEEAAGHHLPADGHEARRASRCGRSSRSTDTTRPTRCSSTTCASRWRTASAKRTRAGTTPSTCSATSAAASRAWASPSSACAAPSSSPRR